MSADEKEGAIKLIQEVYKYMVDFPDDIKVNMVHGEQTTVYHLSCRKEDLGKVFGKQGRNIGAVRSIMACYAAKHRYRAVLLVEE